jgi:hypothetical protein
VARAKAEIVIQRTTKASSGVMHIQYSMLGKYLSLQERKRGKRRTRRKLRINSKPKMERFDC